MKPLRQTGNICVNNDFAWAYTEYLYSYSRTFLLCLYESSHFDIFFRKLYTILLHYLWKWDFWKENQLVVN